MNELKTIVYSYGVRLSHKGQHEQLNDVAGAQHSLRTRYYNDLISIEREIFAAAKAFMDAALGQDWEHRHGPEHYKMVKQTRKAAYAEPHIDALVTNRFVRIREARQNIAKAGMFSHGYLEVERNYNAARTSFYSSLTPPAGRRFTLDNGKLNVLFTTGLNITKLRDPNNRYLQLIALPATSRRSQKSKPHAFKLRVDSDTKGGPIWLEGQVMLHRDLPQAGDVREIALIWNMRGAKKRFTLNITVQTPRQPTLESSGKKTSINLGWKELDDGTVRVGYWLNNHGEKGQILLSKKWRDDFKHVEGIQSMRDKHQNALQAALVAWFKIAPDVPEALRTRVSHIHQWESARRFQALHNYWAQNRFHGDEAGFAALHEWSKRDTHLWHYGGNMRARLIAQRQETFRIFAAGLANTNDEVIFDDFNITTFAHLEKRGNEAPTETRARRVEAAPSLLRLSVINAMQREGKIVTKKKLESSKRCHACQEPYAQVERINACQKCGAVTDTDLNACTNLLEREPEVLPNSPARSRRRHGHKALHELRLAKLANQAAD